MESIKSFLEQWDLLGVVIAAVISLLRGTEGQVPVSDRI